MKNLSTQLAVIFCFLAGLALYLAPQALRAGNTMGYLVLIIAAVLFWNRVQQRHS